LLLI
jgi:hypothetical protein